MTPPLLSSAAHSAATLNSSKPLWSQAFASTPESDYREIDQFCQYGYATFPIIDVDAMISRVDNGDQFIDPDFRCLLLALAAVNEASKLRIDPSCGSTKLLELSAGAETIRSQYDYVTHFTLDTIATSLFLFAANNVAGRHRRAFMYLNEAIGLVDMVEDLPNERARVRYTRIEYVTFIADKATRSIYGTPRQRPLARRPNHIPLSPEMLSLPTKGDSGAFQILEQEAVGLLLHMVRLHTAMDMNDIICLDSCSPRSRSSTRLGPGESNLPPIHYRTQQADVAITRQWLLASKLPSLPAGFQSDPVAVRGLESTLQEMGTTVIQWISELLPGQIRVVGLGKVTAIVKTIHNLALQAGRELVFRNIIQELVLSVCANDPESSYTPRVIECIIDHLYDLPPPMSSPTMLVDSPSAALICAPTRSHQPYLLAGNLGDAESGLDGVDKTSPPSPFPLWESSDVATAPERLMEASNMYDSPFEDEILRLLGL